MECMRQYISELLDFIADMHTLTKLKVSLLCVGLQFGHVSHVESFVFHPYLFFTPNLLFRAI